MSENNDLNPAVSTGIAGLDEILRGGLPHGMSYLIQGGAGTGKTTVGFQFLFEGVRRGQRVLFVSLLQRRWELQGVFASHGWSLEGVDFLDLPQSLRQSATEEQTMFSPGEFELQEVSEAIVEAIERCGPERLVFDSITELATLVDSPRQLRRQMLKFKQRLEETRCTSVFIANDDMTMDMPLFQVGVHGVIALGADQLPAGPRRRWLEVIKVRGVPYADGRHSFRLLTGGIEVYPNLEVPSDAAEPQWSLVSSGNEDLDRLFGGGLEGGTACLVLGTTGAGKSTLASLYVQAAAERGERSIIYCFDERRQTFIRRSQGLGMDVIRHMDEGRVDLRQVNFGSMTFGEFVHDLCSAVEQRGVKVVVIDSLTGFFHAIPEEKLIVQLHEMLTYLGNAGVLTLLILPISGLKGEGISGFDENVSYIADTVVMMRHFEATGEVRRCVSVLKKRHGRHERAIREFQGGPGGIELGPPLSDFRNVLSGMPEYIGKAGKLMDAEKDTRDGSDDGS